MKKLQTLSIICLTALTFISFNTNAQIPDPEDGKGLVVFYRTKGFKGGAIKFSVKDGEKSYGQLKSGTIIYIQAEPGEHTFWSQVISSDAVTLTIEEGKVYYIKGTVKMGAVAGRPKFKEVDENKALKEIKKI